MQKKAWDRWKVFHIRAKRHKQAQRQGQTHVLAPIVTAWRVRAQKAHRAKSFAKLLALKEQHRQGSTCELGAAHVIGVVCVCVCVSEPG